MKTLTRNFPVKVIAFFLAVLCLVTGAACIMVAALLVENDYYINSEEDVTQQLLENQLRGWLYEAAEDSIILSQGLSDRWPTQQTNLRYRVQLEGTLLESSDIPQQFTAYARTTMQLYGDCLYRWGLGPDYYGNGYFLGESQIDEICQLPGIQRYLEAGGSLDALFGTGVQTGQSAPNADTPSAAPNADAADPAHDDAGLDLGSSSLTVDPPTRQPEADDLALTDVPGGLGAGLWYAGETYPSPSITVELWLTDPLTVEDSFARVRDMAHLAVSLRGWLLPMAVVGLLVGLVCLVFLFCAAGHRADCEGIALNPLDRVPLDVYLGVCTAIGCGLFVAVVMCLDYPSVSTVVIAIGAVLLLGALVLGALLSMATRMKAGHMLQNTLVWRLLRPCLLGIRRICQLLGYAFGGIPLVWKTVLVLGGALFADLFFSMILWDSGEGFVLYWFLKAAVLALGALVVALNLRGLQQGIRGMAAGDLDSRVDTRHLIGDFRRSGEDLGRIREGMAHAVDERMKSERLKTELITNVSHDIKTPLTSIINYVDLIKKQQPSDETLCQYIEVLDRQSSRLKKLIEDLIEASKASSGALVNHAEPCELVVLLTQVCGEYSEKLAAAGLSLVTDTPAEPICILADGRHLWRVFDNLMNNICKYAQSGTRVYLSLQRQARQAVVIFRNISRDALNISGEELMERFVRGDRSRHTEGSGLGLSIARSLAEMQHGTLDLDVDGDLFKVTLRFPLLEDADAPALPPA